MSGHMVTMTYNAADTETHEEAAQEFMEWLSSTKHPWVVVKDWSGNQREVEL